MFDLIFTNMAMSNLSFNQLDTNCLIPATILRKYTQRAIMFIIYVTHCRAERYLFPAQTHHLRSKAYLSE